MAISCPQSLHVMDVPLVVVLVLLYMPQGYASIAGSAEGIGTATTDVDNVRNPDPHWAQQRGELVF
jgi:hypothetical protein